MRLPFLAHAIAGIREEVFRKIDGKWEYWGEEYAPKDLVAQIMEEARILVDWHEHKRKSGEKP